ncbi:hypothetical protein [Sphingomonas sp. dw_22]|nr:hypothetical protein [Sphingomonas sp. dw_22]
MFELSKNGKQLPNIFCFIPNVEASNSERDEKLRVIVTAKKGEVS